MSKKTPPSSSSHPQPHEPKPKLFQKTLAPSEAKTGEPTAFQGKHVGSDDLRTQSQRDEFERKVAAPTWREKNRSLRKFAGGVLMAAALVPASISAVRGSLTAAHGVIAVAVSAAARKMMD